MGSSPKELAILLGFKDSRVPEFKCHEVMNGVKTSLWS